MKSLFPFCLFILFALTISDNTIIQLTKLIGFEQVLLISEKLCDDNKNEDSEEEIQEVRDHFLYCHETSINPLNTFAYQLSTLESNNKILFLSHSYIKEIYSPPDFIAII